MRRLGAACRFGRGVSGVVLRRKRHALRASTSSIQVNKNGMCASALAKLLKMQLYKSRHTREIAYDFFSNETIEDASLQISYAGL